MLLILAELLRDDDSINHIDVLIRRSIHCRFCTNCRSTRPRYPFRTSSRTFLMVSRLANLPAEDKIIDRIDGLSRCPAVASTAFQSLLCSPTVYLQALSQVSPQPPGTKQIRFSVLSSPKGLNRNLGTPCGDQDRE